MSLTDHQTHILRHMLGIDVRDVRNPPEYRDYYCSNPECREMVELERLGLIELYEKRGGYWWYCTTDAGKQAARASQRARLRPKSSRVYSRFLDVKDALGDLTFKQFLTDPQFAETRRAA